MSRRTRRSPGLGVLAAVVLAAGPGCYQEAWPGLDFERMLRQPRKDAYEQSALFPDGRAMRTPPEGTVPRRGRAPEPLLSAVGEPLQDFPLEPDRALLERGRERFEIFCGACHGLLGDGDTPVAANMPLRPPPSLHEPRIRRQPPARIYQVVRDGYGLMPGYATELAPADRWAVVAYVNALQASRLPLAEVPARWRDEARAALEGAPGGAPEGSGP